MKQLLLIACIVAGSFSAANAGNGLTQASVDSTIHAEKVALQAKITQLQSNYAANPTSVASVQATEDVHQLLWDGLMNTKHARNLEPDAAKCAAIDTRFQILEFSFDKFHRLRGDLATNHAEMLRHAQAFYSKF